MVSVDDHAAKTDDGEALIGNLDLNHNEARRRDQAALVVAQRRRACPSAGTAGRAPGIPRISFVALELGQLPLVMRANSTSSIRSIEARRGGP